MARALFHGDLDSAGLSPADRALLDYAAGLTQEPSQTTAVDVERLQAHGFNDAQIWLATYTAGIFNLFARMADAHGLRGPQSMVDAVERG